MISIKIFTKLIVGLLLLCGSVAARASLPYDPPVPPFGDDAYLRSLPDETFVVKSAIIVYFGRNTDAFLKYYEKCSVNGFEKSKGGFLGMDVFGDYKETREGVKSISPRALFSAALVAQLKKKFNNVEYAIDEIDALDKAQRIFNALIVGIDLYPAKGCDSGSGGSYGPYDVQGTSYVYKSEMTAKCFNSSKMKGSHIFKAGGGKMGLFDVDFSMLPSWMIKGYAALSAERLIFPCLKPE